ncbi:conserved hypothetical protein [Leishmania major strain Friedlin]|uniref:START domain-containing protein n=1 Tax=Leishmania major TaxID=5664 RepID=Q4QAI3_LEIMA|nr:conserved hypothetical protein [Leishmania major strain Friedlin]CAG9574621.1 hypothetical_protein_-_conserved [Leishmania major strain Friedlin]CAJ05067.1 conserved hypothetical protein [Leishmania major strain Friedlin]|eukprot:XP_001683665.1 conserved hypothetical protein [Leishmania major strain Friedlin]
MSYLLHSSSYAAATAAAERDGPARGAGGGPLNVVLSRVRSLLHGEPSRVARATSIIDDGSSGSLKRAERHSGASSASRREVLLPLTHDSARVARVPEVSGFIEHGGGFAIPAAKASPRTAPTPVAPPTTNESPVHRPPSARPVDAARDASLYERAVDYTDLEEILRCPLPPVPGCPTPCAFGRHSAGLSSDGSVTAAATLSPPPAPSSARQPPLVFRCIAADSDTGISVYSTPAEDCPMHLMRAYAVLPCSPGDVLQYMDNDIRPRWDSHLRRSALLRELTPPEQTKAVERQYRLSTSIGTAGAAVSQRSPTSLSAQSQGALRQRASSSPRTTGAIHGGCGSAVVSGPATAAASSPTAFQYLPGQRRVAIHYLETRSPVPFVQDRDFEIVVAEEVRPDDTAYVKAFSTPLGYHMPLGPHQSRYVRAVVVLSGMVARPLDAARVEEVLPPVLLRHHRAAAQHGNIQVAGIATKKPSASATVCGDAAARAACVAAPHRYCVVEYVGLVHPMGLLPAVLVNMIISAQLNAMRKMQAFIMQHPMSTLRPRSATHAATGEATGQPLQELLVSLQSLSPSPRKSSRMGKSQESDAAGRTREVKPEATGASAASVSAPLAASPAPVWWRRQMHRFASNL